MLRSEDRPPGGAGGTVWSMPGREAEPAPHMDAVGRGNVRRFRVLWGAMILVILGGLTLSAVTEYRAAVRLAEKAAADGALILKQHMQRHFESADLILRHAAAEVAAHGLAESGDAGSLRAVMEYDVIAAGTPWMQGLWVLDATGNARFSSRALEEDLRAAVAGASLRAVETPDHLVIGDVVQGSFTGWPSFVVARAIRDDSGRAIGAAAMALAADQLADIFSRQTMGADGSVALVRTDGMMLARYPALPSIAGRMFTSDGRIGLELRQGMDSNTFRGLSPVDGQERYLSYARVGNLPVLAITGISMADVRARVLEALRPQYALGGLLVAVLALLYPFMMRRLRFERRAARELAERELLFRSILNNVGVGLSLVAADGTIRYANTGLDRLLGYEPGSLTGRNLEDLTHPDDRLTTMYRVSRMEALGPGGLSFEKRYLRRDGSVMEGMVTLSLKPRVGDQEPLLVGVVQDLTEQRAREKAIAFQNSLLRIQQEASPDALLVADAEGRVRAWNGRFRELWSLPQALLDGGELAPVLRHLAKLTGSGGVAADDVEPGWSRRLLADGRVIDTLERELRDGASVSMGRVWFFRDVSQRLAAAATVRESEARYRALVEQSPEAIVVYRDDTVLFANRAGRDLFGYGDREHWPQEVPVSHMVSPAVRAYVRDSIRSNEETPWNGIQEDLQRRDGTLFDAWIISAPVRVNDQPAAQAVIRPLDAGAGVRGRLMQTAKMATLGQMAASVAHELSQPLNILSMGLEGLRLRQQQGAATPDEVAEKLDMAARQCGRMAEIIDHIRVFSRSSKGRAMPFEACGPLRAATDMMRPVFDRDGVALTIAAPDRLGVLEGNPLDLEQVLINLLRNALDALQERRTSGDAPAGWVPAVHLSATVADESGGLLTLEVADNGPGIPASILGDIFEPFFTTKKEGVGTGLGLSICVNAVSKMGGSLRAENRDGAVFILRLPLAAGAVAEAAAAGGVTVGGSAGPAVEGPTGHVLLVEDDATARQALAVVFIEQGFRVSTAGSTAEALGKARLDPPDVLVTDIGLGGGDDGWTLIRRLRDRTPGLPAVVLSGKPVPDDDPRRALADRLLTKPLTTGDAVRAVRGALTAVAEAAGAGA